MNTATAARRPRSWAALVLKVIAAVLGLAVLAAFLGVMAVAGRLRGRFETLNVTFPASAGPTTWAIIGEDEPDAATKLKDGDGSRADIIILVTQAPGGLKVTSVPRDLNLKVGRAPFPERLSAFWLRGPQPFTNAVCEGLGIPLDHIIRFDMQSFSALIDGVGGIDVTLPTAIEQKGLIALPAGTSHLDGRTALAFVRTRHAKIQQGGAWVDEPNGPIMRQHRSVQVFAALLQKMRAQPNIAFRGVWHAAPEIAMDRDAVWLDLLPFARFKGHVDLLPATTKSDVVVEPSAETSAAISALGYHGCQR